MRRGPARFRLLASALLLVFAACGTEPGGPMTVGRQAPAFDLEVLGGGRMASEELAGRPAVLSFWATWCQPCLKEIPVLAELHERGDVRVAAIALDTGGPPVVAPFVAEQGITYPVLLGDQETFERFDGLTIPYTLLLDAEGKVASLYRGVITRDQLRADLAALTSPPGG